ncbi:peptidylprolyl isomerase [filamentous cyanobacterium CCP1]|nr:peptidylprolyl isomerase [filamentous cyanobacterium CCP2]PSB54557.1 peptidylprolyl isomerase [filamentous cyanobacterium CCP1]
MVNFANSPISSERIVDFLKQEVQIKEVSQKILWQQIVSEAAQERSIVVSSDEIQAEADRQRYQMRLESAAATFAWLEDQLITPEDWEAGIRQKLLAQKLSESLFADEVERYFAEHRLDFEQVSLYRITVPYEQLSQELFYQIEENEISFYEAAHLYDIDEQRRLQCGYEGRFYRWSLKAELAAAIFGSSLGTLIGPLKNEHGYDLFLVEEFISAELTPVVRQEIIDRLFKEWLVRELNYLIHNQ